MRIYAKSGSIIHIGRVGENLVTDVIFDISKWFGTASEGKIEDLTGEIILYINKDSSTYVIDRTTGDLFYNLSNNQLITWKIKNSFLGVAGQGKCEIRYQVNEQVIFSEIYDFIVTRSLTTDVPVDPPDYLKNYIENLTEEAIYIHNNIDSANTLSKSWR